MSEADTPLDADAVAAIVAHMNADHRAESLQICRTLGGQTEAIDARAVDVDRHAITFVVTVGGAEHHVLVPWFGEVRERADVRREVVELTRRAAASDESG